MTMTIRPLVPMIAVLAGLPALSCGASAPKRSTSSYEAAASMPMEPAAHAKAASMGYGGYAASGSMDELDYDMAPMDMAEAEYALPEPTTAGPASGGDVLAAVEVPPELEGVKYAQATAKGEEKEEPTSEKKAPAAHDRLILYTAEMGVAVFRVEEKIEEIRKMIGQWGGYLVSMDSNRIVFRVPAALFEEAMDDIGELGDVTYRNVQGTDVTEEFRDLKIRLGNAEAVRDRFLELLSQAKNINESLQVEHELERITEKIELMKGRLKYLSEAAMYSKITVHLAVKTKAKKPIPPLYAPFKWIQDIGLDTLFSF